jgi:hypothetical protein
LSIILDLKGDKIVQNVLNMKVKGKRRNRKEARRCEQHIRQDMTQREGRTRDETEKALWEEVNNCIFLISRRPTDK